MTNTRRIAELVHNNARQRLIGQLVRHRSDLPDWLASELSSSPVAVAAVAIVRLSELEQTTTPVFMGLVQQLLVAQDSDGGWGNTMTTALAIRALVDVEQASEHVAKAIEHLGGCQKDDGSWPLEPFRRMPTDLTATAFLLVQLARHRGFISRIRLEAAIGVLVESSSVLSAEQKQLAKIAILRAGAQVAGQAKHLLRFS